MSVTAIRTLNNTFISFGSNILIKFFAFISTIFIARIVNISDFGSFSFVITIVALLNLIVDFGIGTVLIKEGAQDFNQFKKLFPTALVLRLFWGCLLSIVVISLLFILKLIPSSLTLMFLFYLLSIIPMGVINLINATFTSREKIYVISILSFSVSLLHSLASILIVLLGGDLNMIAISFYISLIVHIVLLFEMQRRLYFDIHYDFNYKLAKDLIISGIPFFVIALQTVLYYRIDVIMLMSLKGEASVAFYNVANRYTDFLIILPGILASVTLPVLAKFAKESALKMFEVSQRIIKYSFLFGLGLTMFLVVFSPQLILLPFGEKFAHSIPTMMILSLTLLFVFINSPLTLIFYASGITKSLIIVPATLIVVNVILNLLFIPPYSEFGSGISTVITEAVGLILIVFLIKKHQLKFDLTLFVKNTSKVFFSGVIAFGCIAPFIKTETSIMTLLLFLAMFTLYFLCLFLFRTFDAYDFDLFRIFYQKYFKRLT